MLIPTPINTSGHDKRSYQTGYYHGRLTQGAPPLRSRGILLSLAQHCIAPWRASSIPNTLNEAAMRQPSTHCLLEATFRYISVDLQCWTAKTVQFEGGHSELLGRTLAHLILELTSLPVYRRGEEGYGDRKHSPHPIA